MIISVFSLGNRKRKKKRKKKREKEKKRKLKRKEKGKEKEKVGNQVFNTGLLEIAGDTFRLYSCFDTSCQHLSGSKVFY